MPQSFNEQKKWLLNKIMIATSQEEVQKFIDITVKALQKNEKEKMQVSDFVDTISNELYLFNPLKIDAQQWSNIKMARIVFNRFKYHWGSAV
jgi:hypothetical protein